MLAVQFFPTPVVQFLPSRAAGMGLPLLLCRKQPVKKPIHFHPEHYQPATKTVGRLPPGVGYRMAHAHRQCWMGSDFWLAEQYHDGRHAFAGVVEAQCRQAIRMTVHCQHGDVIWAYLLDGQLGAVAANPLPGLAPVQLSGGQYLPVYVAAGQYTLTLPAGRHLLFYFVLQLDWLRRYRRDELAAIAPLLRGVQRGYALGQALPLHGRHRRLLLHLRYLEQSSLTLAQDVALYPLLVNLIYYYLDELAVRERAVATPEDAAVSEIAAFIDREVVRGNIPTLPELCQGFGLTEKTLYNHFTKVLHVTPGQYIHQARMEEAHRLLAVEGYKPTTVAYQLGYEHLRTFERAFKKHFGKTPRELKGNGQ